MRLSGLVPNHQTAESGLHWLKGLIVTGIGECTRQHAAGTAFWHSKSRADRLVIGSMSYKFGVEPRKK